jgi:hypothetical protein
MATDYWSGCARASNGPYTCGACTLAVGYHSVFPYRGVCVTKPEVENGRLTRRYFRFFEPGARAVGAAFLRTGS